MMLLLFPTEQECVDANAQIFENLTSYWVSIGYTVTEEGVVGKTAGEDNPDAVKITAWDVPKDHGDGWVITDPTGQFPNTVDPMAGVSGYTRIDPSAEVNPT